MFFREIRNYKSLGQMDPPWYVEQVVPKLRVVHGRGSPKTIVVCLAFKCAALSQRWRDIMKDFNPKDSQSLKDGFLPHVTLSYDAQSDTDWERVDVLALCPEVANLEIVEEYKDQFDKDWDKKLH